MSNMMQRRLARHAPKCDVMERSRLGDAMGCNALRSVRIIPTKRCNATLGRAPAMRCNGMRNCHFCWLIHPFMKYCGPTWNSSAQRSLKVDHLFATMRGRHFDTMIQYMMCWQCNATVCHITLRRCDAMCGPRCEMAMQCDAVDASDATKDDVTLIQTMRDIGRHSGTSPRPSNDATQPWRLITTLTVPQQSHWNQTCLRTPTCNLFLVSLSAQLRYDETRRLLQRLTGCI